MKVEYQWEKFITEQKPVKDIERWVPDYGPFVLSRKDEKAEKVRFRILIDNPGTKVFLVGKFSDWKKDSKFEFKHDEFHVFGDIIIDCIKHRDPYKIFVVDDMGERFMQDPAGHFFDDEGNTIFWDFGDPSTYKKRFGLVDTINRSTKILQTDLPGLISHWKDKDGVMGKDILQKEYLSFISDSGILEHIRSIGFNTIQFLPFAQSIDGDNWKFRYLVPFQFAIQKNWGDPDEFSRMIDECHRLGIAVIGDFVISHLPFKDYSIFGKSGQENGIHRWKNRHGTRIYTKEVTPWGTMRIDYENKYVRKFIVESCLHFLKHYRVDGYRIDNVDGIIRYGANGEGEERPNGRVFLRELNQTIYEYNPFALIHFESHYYFEDNAKMLVLPFEEDSRALGATAYNSSRITFYFHTEYMPKSAEKITPWKFRDITEEKEWGQSNSTVADFHNHDAAAGLMENRCTGSYAYDAMTCKQPHNHHHAIGKIKVMEAIISFMAEGRTLDLLQTFLLQNGTFEHDSSIQWFLAFNECNNNMVEYKKKINEIMDDPAFWPRFIKNREFLNVDDKNKIIVIKRSAEYDGKKSLFLIVINLSSWIHHDYKVGVKGKKDYELVLNSDRFMYSGTGVASYPKRFTNISSKNFEVLNREIVLPKIGEYGVVVLKEKT